MNVVDIPIRPDVAHALAFLRGFRPTGWLNLTAIHPDLPEGSPGKIRGITRCVDTPESWPEIERFIVENNETRNLYFAVNEPRAGAPDGKLNKADISRIWALFIDADPRKDVETQPGGFDIERERLREFTADLADDFLWAPTYVIDSGSGHQCIWLLDEPVDATAHRKLMEGIGRGLADKFDTDHVQNIDRVLRLPGTVNLPDPKKRKRGRRKALARLLFETGRRYSSVAMAEYAPPSYGAEAQHDLVSLDAEAVNSVADINDLPEDLRAKLEQALARNDALRRRWQGDAEGLSDSSRSGFDLAVARQLVQEECFGHWQDGKFDATEIGMVLAVNPFGKQADLTIREITRTVSRCEPRAPADVEFEPAPPDYDLDQQIKARHAAEVAAAQQGAGRKTERAKLFYLRPSEVKLPDASLYLIKGVLDQETTLVWYGHSNTGKTFAAMDVCAHIAAGRPWGGRKVRQGLVVYVAAEAGRSAEKRVLALKQRLGTDDFPFALVPCPVDMLDPDADTKPLIELVKQAEKDFGQKCVLVVIDTLSRAFAGGNENSSEDMGAFVANCDQVRVQCRTALGIVHHKGKNDAAGARGHSSLRAAIETEIEVEVEPSGGRRLVFRKQRDMESEPPIGFALHTVELGTTAEGDVISSCIVVLEGEAAYEFAAGADKGAIGPQLGANARAVLAQFERALAGGPGVPAGSVVRLDDGSEAVVEGAWAWLCSAVWSNSDDLAPWEGPEQSLRSLLTTTTGERTNYDRFRAGRSELVSRRLLKKVGKNQWVKDGW